MHERDGGQCTYVDAHGRRCKARDRLEFHHRKPFGLGGDHSPENTALACRVHNVLLAEQDYGQDLMSRYRGGSDRVSEPVVPYRWQGQPIARHLSRRKAISRRSTEVKVTRTISSVFFWRLCR